VGGRADDRSAAASLAGKIVLGALSHWAQELRRGHGRERGACSGGRAEAGIERERRVDKCLEREHRLGARGVVQCSADR
jgi:hypothetical protein